MWAPSRGDLTLLRGGSLSEETGSLAGKTGSLAGETGSLAGETGSLAGETGTLAGETGSLAGESYSWVRGPTQQGSGGYALCCGDLTEVAFSLMTSDIASG